MGVSGEHVVKRMTSRFAKTLKDASDAGKHYAVTILLGGINDLSIKTHNSFVFDGITSMIREARMFKTHVLLLTLLGTSAVKTKHDDSRMHLNRRLRLLPNHPEFGDSVTILDMDLELPFREAESAGLYDDGLHLTPEGYDKLGQVIYKALVPLLQSLPD